MTQPTTDPATPEGFRIERDTMGDVLVPADALYAAQTQRAVENFPVSGVRVDPAVVRALARVKAAAARVNARLGVLPQDVADAVARAADAVAGGAHADAFPVDVFQTGSGTSTNMNMNEVLGTLATAALGRAVHPNDEVNASQSSNDTFPTAVHLAATGAVLHELVPALEHLAEALERKASATAEVVKPGRTHLMDATPVTLGQELGGYAAQVRRGVERLHAALPRFAEVPLGGTAVGTGINTPPGFAAAVVAELATTTGLPVTQARDHFEAQGARDGLVELSGVLRTVAVEPDEGLQTTCDGWGRGRLPGLGRGQAARPPAGLVDHAGQRRTRSLPECVLGQASCAQVVGNDACRGVGRKRSGTFELNCDGSPCSPGVVLESVRLLANGARLLADRCVDGIEPDVARGRRYASPRPPS